MHKQRNLWDISWVQLVYGIVVKLFFVALNAAYIPLLLIFERCVIPTDRPHLWRLVAHRNTRLLLKISGIRLHVDPEIHKHTQEPSVFVSNHPSILDGFTFFALLGPEIIPLTEPTDIFVFPFSLWFRKMRFVGVLRDEYDKSHHADAYTASEAIAQLKEELVEHKRNVLIFPEGHLERMHKLHYIHTGAARTAIAARAPVIPLAMVNVERVIIDKWRARPGNIYIRFHPPLRPPQVSAYHHTAVRAFSNDIRDAIIFLLPSRNLPVDINDPHPEQIGVFVDIDHTLYEGYSQQDFVKWMMKKGVVSHLLTYKVAFYLLLEKLHILTHEEMMKHALGFTRGWKAVRLEEYTKEFFKTQVIPHLYHHMLPILKDHQKRGHTIILITEVIEPVAKEFKKYCKAKDYRSTLLEKQRGVYTGTVTRLCWNHEKGKQASVVVKKYAIDLSKSYAYGDSFADIPMLKLVKHKVAVHPDGGLMKEALEYHWNILH